MSLVNIKVDPFKIDQFMDFFESIKEELRNDLAKYNHKYNFDFNSEQPLKYSDSLSSNEAIFNKSRYENIDN